MQNLKVEINAIKKTQAEGILEMENLGKRMGTTDASIINRIQEISGIEDTWEKIDTSVKENVKAKKNPWHKTSRKWQDLI